MHSSVEMVDFEPPLHARFYALMEDVHHKSSPSDFQELSVLNECELPLIDLTPLTNSDYSSERREKCINEIIEAASEWGFFQVTNHGVQEKVLEAMKHEQEKVFHEPFIKKSERGFSNLRSIYRWGNPTATSLSQLSWSEAFHIPMVDVSSFDEHKSFRSTSESLVAELSSLAESLAVILGQKVGIKSIYFQENCPTAQSYLRLNRYPPCPVASEVHGLIAHTDSDFLTIVFQDQVGGLQLMKDGTWFSIKPNPKALLINIGDLFQAMSNGVYKSLKHRVLASEEVERYSIAYFYCPSDNTVIQRSMTMSKQPSIYKNFSFGEYRKQTDKDSKENGNKVGLSRFLL